MTALREAPTGSDGKTATRRALPGQRWVSACGLVCLVAVALGLRLVPVVFAPSLNWGDEVFQTVEPAHRLIYGYGLVTWEFQVGMRSWLLPGTLAGLIGIARIVGDGPEYYQTAIALALGLLACAPVVCCFLWCRRFFGLAGAVVAAWAVAVAPELVYFGARTLNEVVAAHLLVIALYLVAPGTPVDNRRRLFGAGILLGIICLLRLQLAPAVAVIALWPGSLPWRTRLPALIGGGAATLLFGAALDWATLGYPLASVWRNLYYNLHLGISSGFSVEPWFYYLLGEVGVWLAAAPFVLLLVALGARRMPMLLVVALVVVAVHSAIPHKEYRFIYPAVVLAMVLAAFGLAQLTQGAAQRLGARGMRQGVATAISVIAIAGGWSAVAFGVWSNGALALLRHRAHDELAAVNFVRDMPAPSCGVGLYGEEAWVRYGGYTHLHRPLPLYWPKDIAALTASAAGFDTLIYDIAPQSPLAPPPPELGFAQLRCFGPICVARRPGTCEPRPLPAMWFPPKLRGTAPARPEFDAVPPRARPDTAGQAR